MISINLLFLSAFVFLGNAIFRRHNTAKYATIASLMIFINLPIFFVLWDFYSLTMLFFSLFGEASLFCTLLCATFILQNLAKNISGFCEICAKFCNCGFCDCGFCDLNNAKISQNLIIFIFSLTLFLGQLDVIAFDFSRNLAPCAVFIGAFIIALYFANKFTATLALVAFLFGGEIFALFDGYLLIYSGFYCAIWGIKSLDSAICRI
ncbi:hypothetical protein ACWIUD_04765 [Helicobacter sp. 23-1044]